MGWALVRNFFWCCCGAVDVTVPNNNKYSVMGRRSASQWQYRMWSAIFSSQAQFNDSSHLPGYFPQEGDSGSDGREGERKPMSDAVVARAACAHGGEPIIVDEDLEWDCSRASRRGRRRQGSELCVFYIII